MKWPRWPWRPREYVAVVAALHEAEAALQRRQTEATKQRQAQTDVRRELHQRRERRR